MQQQFSKELYLIRHGETEPNRNQIIQGSGLDASLNSRGKNQADLFYHQYHKTGFDWVYTSALKRTSESVQGFIKAGIPHTILPELNEISWGVKDGTKINPEEQNEYDCMLNAWKSGNLDLKFPGGESPNEVAQRLNIALDNLMAQQEAIILVCMHGRAMRILLCLLLELPLSEMEQFLHSNLCLYQLGWDGLRWQILVENDTTHLQ